MTTKQELAADRVRIKRSIRVKLLKAVADGSPAALTQEEAGLMLLGLTQSEGGCNATCPEHCGPFWRLGPTLAEVHAIEEREAKRLRREAEEAGYACDEPCDSLYPPDRP
jgi:hypothetical protein